jgi:hypothetical protein
MVLRSMTGFRNGGGEEEVNRKRVVKEEGEEEGRLTENFRR